MYLLKTRGNQRLNVPRANSRDSVDESILRPESIPVNDCAHGAFNKAGGRSARHIPPGRESPAGLGAAHRAQRVGVHGQERGRTRRERLHTGSEGTDLQ